MQKHGSGSWLKFSPFAVAALLGGIDVSLLMPAASHPHAGALTQALALAVAFLALALLAVGLVPLWFRRP